MEEIEVLVAAGGAVCELCKGQMLKADGCTGQESIVKASIISVSGMVTNADTGGMNAVTTVEQSGVSIIMQTAM